LLAATASTRSTRNTSSFEEVGALKDKFPSYREDAAAAAPLLYTTPIAKMAFGQDAAAAAERCFGILLVILQQQEETEIDALCTFVDPVSFFVE
jgi:hypothetical protein